MIIIYFFIQLTFNVNYNEKNNFIICYRSFYNFNFKS